MTLTTVIDEFRGLTRGDLTAEIVQLRRQHDELVAERDRYMGWYYAEVTKRDELVAALKPFANLDRDVNGKVWYIRPELCDAARAALAKVKGTP